ncbi:MAG: helix-turn-helix domain-containing protein [Bacteroidaceae bacterium]|nr:helix-turn-helix domain-containing protein [Bacteroidaceae bacterium]
MKTQQNNIQEQDFLFLHDVEEACSGQYALYFLHIFIQKGSMSFRINERLLQAHTGYGIILIDGKPLQDLHTSTDFDAEIFLISTNYLQANMPRITKNVKGLTFYYDNPLMPMTEADMQRCLMDLQDILMRLQEGLHLYHAETLQRSIDNFTFDLFDIYTRCNSKQAAKDRQAAIITQRFVNLLKEHVKVHRQVEFYAEKLCITPKYLSRVCQETTGQNASHWIIQFTLSRIIEELADGSKSLTEISDAYNFKALSHFTRYIKQHTGMTPSEYQKRNR